MKQSMKIATIAVALGLLGGCASQSRTEAEFGDAVREVMRNQIHDENAANYPNPDAVEGGDPYRLEKVMQTHRGDVADPRPSAAAPVSISINPGR